MVLMMAIILFCILIPFVLIFLFTGSFGRRIAVIRGEMHKISEGNLDIIPLFDGTDELGLLFRDMQQTINNIQNLNRQLYENQLDRQRLMNQQRMIEFQMLANQINPHFLFNTLETIRMNASTHKDPDTAYIITQLGKMMRYSLQTKDQLVSLAQELAYTRSYLEIQQSRYRDIMEFEINIPPELDEVMVPKLTLQPLAENALYHGIKNKRGKGKILIEGFNLGDDMMLRVTDNGQGMTPERLYEVQEAIRTGERAGFGLAAVSERIVLYYGPGYGLKISSTEGEGTVMEVYMAKKINLDNNSR